MGTQIRSKVFCLQQLLLQRKSGRQGTRHLTLCQRWGAPREA